MGKKDSKRTKDVKKLSRIFLSLSFVCFIGVALFSVIAIFTRINGSEEKGIEIISEALKTRLISLSVTMIIGVVLALIIKDKVRTTIYMLALVINSILFKEVGMYVILGIWAIDEYIFTNLHKHYKQLAIINKEIDRRQTVWLLLQLVETGLQAGLYFTK